jgi:hypothetical protein
MFLYSPPFGAEVDEDEVLPNVEGSASKLIAEIAAKASSTLSIG